MNQKHMAVLAAAVMAAAISACGQKTPAPATIEEEPATISPERAALASPPKEILAQSLELNPRRGRILFIAKGCVICHQVNGVGGTAAPDLSAQESHAVIDPLEFSSRMWRGAPAMAALQKIELGYVIDLPAQDIADLAAFAASPEEQALLTLSSVGPEMQSWFLNIPHWTSGDWEEYLRRGERIPAFDDDGDQ